MLDVDVLVEFDTCHLGAGLQHLDVPVGVDPAGQRAMVVGRSPILGEPVGILLLARDATVTYCHSKTVDLAGVVGDAEIVVAAVGRHELIKVSWIKSGAVVIDARL